MGAHLEFYNTYIAPVVDGGVALGTASKQFGGIYINGMAYIDGLGEDLLVDNSFKIQFRDNAIYINSAGDGRLDLTADIAIDFNAGGGQVTVTDGAMSPFVDDDVDLGTSTERYKTAYLTHLNAVGVDNNVVMVDNEIVFS